MSSMTALLVAVAMLQDVPAALLVDEQNGEDIFPPHFQGVWAPNLRECSGDGLEIIEIQADRYFGYESDSRLLKLSGVVYHTAPDGQPAYTVVGLVAFSAEGEVGIGRIRFIRTGDYLYTSNPEAVTEEEQWQYRNIRCPDRAR